MSTPPDADPIIVAAVECFGRNGFGTPLRSVAAGAGVSAALLIKRFGSKDGLHAECDAYVREWIRTVKHENIDAVAQGRLLPSIIDDDALQPMFAYIMQSVMAGGDIGRAFVDGMIADAQAYMADAVAKGVIRPTDDEAARARYLVTSSLGSLLLTVLLEQTSGDQLADQFRRLLTETSAPMVELYAHGLFTDPEVLDQYADQLKTPHD